jgi:hypothetical protein
MLARAMRRFVSVLGVCATVGVGVGGGSGTALADEPPLKLMREPVPFTDVADAADGDDPFDINGHIAFSRTTDTGTIQREFTTSGGERRRTSIADSSRVTSQLNFGLDIGLFHDLMAFVRLPLILSDARSLALPDGKTAAQVQRRLEDPGDYRGDGSLFALPFDSPSRAGFDYIGLGVEWGILNQQRASHFPTWVVIVEGRRAIGTPLAPCSEAGGKTSCGTRGDADGDEKADQGTSLKLNQDSAGSSRGVSGVLVETRASYRYRYLEPYVGAGFMVEWASTAKKYYNPGGNLEGTLNRLPSRQTFANVGASLIPWENRARFQRVALDVRLNGTWLSEGREYSALYDALGTSAHQALAVPIYEGYERDGRPKSLKEVERVPFYGLTDVQSRMRYGLRAGLEMQAAQYVRFSFGTAINWVTAHSLTFADPCNPSVTDETRRFGPGGNDCGSGIVNTAHRALIDSPGRRFWMTGEMLIDLYATATAQF